MKNSLPARKMIRLKNFDYSNEGMYFITICTRERKQVLSKICDIDCRGRALPLPEKTNIGVIIENSIKYFNNKYTDLEIAKYIIMPNHIHMIIHISGKDRALPLQDIIRSFKSYTTVQCYKKKYLNKQKLWQRNYYEHVIRNETEYWEIYKYIEDNPINWKKDKYF